MLTQSTQTEQNPAEAYLARVRQGLADVPLEEQRRLLTEVRARLELELELAGLLPTDAGSAPLLIEQIGEPEVLARRIRAQAVLSETLPKLGVTKGSLTSCRSCNGDVIWDAVTCPHCGAPKPAQQAWNGPGYEWKSKQTVFGLPLVHVAAGRDAQGKRRVAKGIIAIGQFAVGGIVIAQFGVGAVFGLGQFVAAPISVGQFAFGLAAVGQFAIGLLFGLGMVATGWKTIGLLTLQKLFR